MTTACDLRGTCLRAVGPCGRMVLFDGDFATCLWEQYFSWYGRPLNDDESRCRAISYFKLPHAPVNQELGRVGKTPSVNPAKGQVDGEDVKGRLKKSPKNCVQGEGWQTIQKDGLELIQ